MFNNSLINEEARRKIAERDHEAETYRLQNQLGYRDRGTIKWVAGFITLVAALSLVVLLL